jgi:signal peptidase I
MRFLFKLAFWTIAVVGAFLGLLYAVLFDVWVVPADDPMLSASIEPNLSAGDVVVLSRAGSIGYGNLLRCSDPQAPGRYVVARAIGHSGDKVAIEDERVLVDGKRNPSPHSCDVVTRTLRDPSINDDVDLVCNVEDYGGVEFDALRSPASVESAATTTNATVELGRWFLVSDDRHIHVDSRDYGSVDPAACKHIIFRIVGAAGFGDGKSRFSIIW